MATMKNLSHMWSLAGLTSYVLASLLLSSPALVSAQQAAEANAPKGPPECPPGFVRISCDSDAGAFAPAGAPHPGRGGPGGRFPRGGDVPAGAPHPGPFPGAHGGPRFPDGKDAPAGSPKPSQFGPRRGRSGPGGHHLAPAGAPLPGRKFGGELAPFRQPRGSDGHPGFPGCVPIGQVPAGAPHPGGPAGGFPGFPGEGGPGGPGGPGGREGPGGGQGGPGGPGGRGGPGGPGGGPGF